ncbi:hypothetical protein [Ottowia sp.]|uniref:hypothetical protein n=1 Tax=Ottowia sp. TaxID=1898956 RepID=UPI0039E318DE
MNKSLILLALLVGAAAHAEQAQAPQPEKANASQRAARAAAPAPESSKPIDLSHLVPKDSAQKSDDDWKSSGDRVNSRGVNCSLYPARCS